MINLVARNLEYSIKRVRSLEIVLREIRIQQKSNASTRLIMTSKGQFDEDDLEFIKHFELEFEILEIDWRRYKKALRWEKLKIAILGRIAVFSSYFG